VNQRTDCELLREYAESGSESAFAELVSGHIGLVYSVALRVVVGSAFRRGCDPIDLHHFGPRGAALSGERSRQGKRRTLLIPAVSRSSWWALEGPGSLSQKLLHQVHTVEPPWWGAVNAHGD